MIVMPSNQTGFWCGYLAHKYEDERVSLGHLFSPGGELGRGPVMQYALDNGAFGCWAKGRPFDVPAWMALLEWAEHSILAPMWALVPDAVGDRDQTLRLWDIHAPTIQRMGWKLAFAAQDGMTFADVPAEASIVFIGGSDEFKASALYPWCAKFRCHVGRVTALDHLFRCLDAGAVSCDATGHFRTDRQRKNLTEFLDAANRGRLPLAQRSLSFANSETEDGGSSLCGTVDLAPLGGRN